MKVDGCDCHVVSVVVRFMSHEVCWDVLCALVGRIALSHSRILEESIPTVQRTQSN